MHRLMHGLFSSIFGVCSDQQSSTGLGTADDVLDFSQRGQNLEDIEGDKVAVLKLNFACIKCFLGLDSKR